MKGRRVYPDAAGRLSFAEGDYGKDLLGVWFARPPGGMLGSLEEHSITEYEDGTITVAPSILIEASATTPQWHGYLVHGVWSKA